MYYTLKTHTNLFYLQTCRKLNETTDCQQTEVLKNGPTKTSQSEVGKTPHFVKIFTNIVQTKQSDRSYSQYSNV